MSAQAVSERPRWTSVSTAWRAPIRRPGPMTLVLLGCLGVGALSLLTLSAPTYDPWSWIIWGREILHGDLVTTEGPSWKPLPVLFTTPFALFGDDAAPALWLVVARAGGLLAFAMAYRLGTRLAGEWAGAIAAVSLLLADEFIRNFARGNSEGLLVALVLWAVERHMDGRRSQAFILGFGAALLRPEVWPFWALYGLWLVYQAWDGSAGSSADAAGGRGRRELALVAGLGALALVLWFVPEYLGSGDWLRAANRARDPNPDSAAFAAFPFLEVFRRSAAVLSPPVYAGALVATAIALRRRDHVQLALTAMTQVGFAGNLRYVALPAALLCVLAGAGWVEVVRAARRWAPLVAILLAAAAWPFVAADIHKLEEDRELNAYESNFYGPNLEAAIAKVGGEAKIKSCGRVFTGPFQVPSVAWQLHVHMNQVEIFVFGPGTALSMGATHLSVDPRYPEITKTRHWIVGSSCGRG